jgi:hypothetical protein
VDKICCKAIKSLNSLLESGVEEEEVPSESFVGGEAVGDGDLSQEWSRGRRSPDVRPPSLEMGICGEGGHSPLRRREHVA